MGASRLPAALGVGPPRRPFSGAHLVFCLGVGSGNPPPGAVRAPLCALSASPEPALLGGLARRPLPTFAVQSDGGMPLRYQGLRKQRGWEAEAPGPPGRPPLRASHARPAGHLPRVPSTRTCSRCVTCGSRRPAIGVTPARGTCVPWASPRRHREAGRQPPNREKHREGRLCAGSPVGLCERGASGWVPRGRVPGSGATTALSHPFSETSPSPQGLLWAGAACWHLGAPLTSDPWQSPVFIRSRSFPEIPFSSHLISALWVKQCLGSSH